jgi:hypothetical protein
MILRDPHHLKPSDYRETYVVSQDLSFCAIQLSIEGTSQRQGTLHTGQMVSLQATCPATASDAQVSVYAEGLGLVRINSRWLNRMR